jgi:hypothetical protein
MGMSSSCNPKEVIEQLHHFTAYFNITITQMSLRLTDFQSKIEGYKHTLKSHLTQQRARLQKMTSGIIHEYIKKFQKQTNQLVTDHLSTILHARTAHG